MLKLQNLTLHHTKFNQQNIVNLVCEKLKIKQEQITQLVMLKQSIDSRRKPNVNYVFSVGVEVANYTNKTFDEFEYCTQGLSYQKISHTTRPIIIGFGPSGMFCALSLALMGLKPIVVEQGMNVDDREIAVTEFWKTGKLNPHCNVQFGEGGAGTFSDGKLNTNSSNKLISTILNELIINGAPQDIAYLSKPHIGSDKLKVVVKNIRQKIISLGGEVLFNTQFVDFDTNNNHIYSVIVKNLQTNEVSTLITDNLILAVGHSARQTYSLLFDKKLNIEQKPFAMGVRIEGLQSDINFAQYGLHKSNLPSADYKLVAHLKNNRSIFTFCMCPGGMVVNSASEQHSIVTNGMSNYARDLQNANSAVLVNVLPSDFNSTHPLAGMHYQEKYEQLAYGLTNNHTCPAMSVGEFLTNKPVSNPIKTSTAVTYADIKKCLPEFVTQTLMLGLPELDKKLKGFAKSTNVLIAIESRSSSPVTIVRDHSLQSNILGIYPCGEGAGYAGGIMTSAIDGIKVAQSIYDKLVNNN